MPISKAVVVQQRVGEGDEVSSPANQFESTPSPTAYVILSRPTSLYKPVSTSTPVPAFFSNQSRALELYPLLPRVVISQVSISPNNNRSSDSYVILINNSVEISISEWTLSNGNQQTCKFRSVRLESNSVMKVTSDVDSLLESEVSCTGSTEFWNSQPSILQLQDPMGNVVDQWINIRATEIGVVEVQ